MENEEILKQIVINDIEKKTLEQHIKQDIQKAKKLKNIFTYINCFSDFIFIELQGLRKSFKVNIDNVNVEINLFENGFINYKFEI
jgi:hypothetical protein